MEIYLDIVILLNFGVDLMLLWAANRLSGYPPGGRRVVLSAAMGGAYAGLCFVPGCTFLSTSFCHILCLVVISVCAFGWNRTCLHRGALFILLSMALGGIAVIIHQGGMQALLLSGGILVVLCLLCFRGKKRNEIFASVEITHRGRKLNLTALIDTGNTLQDPVTGWPVLVADARAAMELLRLTSSELEHPIDTISRGNCPGLRLIPYCAIGQPTGLLLGLKVDSIRINGKISQQIVAFAPQRIGCGHLYEALAGGIV